MQEVRPQLQRRWRHGTEGRASIPASPAGADWDEEGRKGGSERGEREAGNEQEHEEQAWGTDGTKEDESTGGGFAGLWEWKVCSSCHERGSSV